MECRAFKNVALLSLDKCPGPEKGCGNALAAFCRWKKGKWFFFFQNESEVIW